MEFYTGSYDGSIKFWDGRDLHEPVQEILLDPSGSEESSRAKSHGAVVLEFEYTIPVRFMIASDLGTIFVGNRKGTTPLEIIINHFKLFRGPIRTVERNPFFVKNFLITGDRCAKIWAEEVKNSPSTLLIKRKHQISCGSWSTSRCSLFVTGDIGGNVDFWDLLLHHRKPIFSLKFGCAIMHVKFRSDGRYLGIGLKNGETHIMEMDLAMKYGSSKERSLIASLFEREILRSKLLDGRVEELKLRQKAKLELENIDLIKAPPEEVKELDPSDPEQLLEMIELDPDLKYALINFRDTKNILSKKRRLRPHIRNRTHFEILAKRWTSVS